MAVKLPSLETQERPTPRPGTGVAGYRGATGAETVVGEAAMRMGAQLGQAGDEIYAALKVEEERTNTTRAEEALSKLREKQLDLTIGPENGYNNLKGAAAVNRPLAKEWGEKFNQAYRDIESTLGNDDQKAKFKQRATIARLQYDEGILRHLASENDTSAKQMLEGAIRTEVASAQANPYSGEAMAIGLERVQNIVRKEVQRQGYMGKEATEQTEIAMRKVRDSMWTARIEAVMYRQPMTAEKLFRDNAEQISDPALRLQLQAKTREAAFGVQGSMEAQKIIDEYRSSPERVGGVVDVKLGARAQELADKQFAGTATKAEVKELTGLYKQMRPGGGEVDPAVVQAGGMPGTDPATANTSGMPIARDIAAELPFMLTKVEKRADALYGTDPSNPDRAAFVKRVTQELQAKISADVQQLNAIQKKNQGTIIDAVAGMSAPGSGVALAGGRGGSPGQMITSFAQIQANPTLFAAWQGLDVQAKVAAMNMIEANQRADQKGDEKLYWDTWNRIHLPVGDPKKIDFYGQIIGLAGPGKLSTTQIGQLRAEIDRAETPGGRSVTQLRKAADSSVENWFRTNLNTNLLFMDQKLTNPTAYMDWTNRWREEVGKKIDALIAADNPGAIRNLFQLDSKESVIKPEYLQTFMGAQGATLKDQADAVRAGAPAAGKSIAQPKTIDTREKLDAWVKTLPADVTTFVGTDGKAYKVPGRAVQPAAEAVPARGEPASAAPLARMDDTGKIVTPPAPKPARDPDALPKFAGSRYAVSPEEQARMDMHFGGLKAAVIAAASTVGNAVVEAGMAGVRTRTELVDMIAGLVGTAKRDTARATFRAILEAESFASEDVPVIQAALKYGDLSAAEKKKARAMLKAAGAD